ncbi:YlxR family protein [Glutamicibacter ectropisis]|uniref:YlxR family protein n=1 Tax=Glutamicibacter ectropisis TaxID=3046593 RepID=A0AAU6WG14_9MICC
MKLHQQRTCIGCRTVTSKNELLRWVLTDGAPLKVVSLDLEGSAFGRGTWTHATQKCVRQAVQRKAFARTFRSAVDDSQVAQAFTAYEDQLAASQQSGKHDESGSEI